MKKMNMLKKLYRKVVGFFGKYIMMGILTVGTVWLLVDAAWTILNIYDYYNATKSLEHNNWLWIFIIALPVAITLFYVMAKCKIDKLNKEIQENNATFLRKDEIIQFHRNIIEDCFDDIYKEHKDLLTKDIESACNNRNWKQVIKFGKYGARLFLMLARYDLRIEYGKYIINAAEKISEKESIAMGYIDCIGWSYVCKNELELAKENIDKGLSIIRDVKSEESYIMYCKAYRHLVGIELRKYRNNNDKSHLDAAMDHRDRFENYLKKLKGRKKKIMKASLCIIDGDIIASKEQDFEKAKELYENAQNTYKVNNNFERAVKVNYKLGEINETMGQDKKALREYLIGFWLSDKMSRIDEKHKNCRKICQLLEKNDDMLSEILEDVKLKQIFDENEIKCKTEKQDYLNELECLEKKIKNTYNYS